MAYQGGAGDERIIQRGAISPELPLPPGDAPPPLPHAKILAQTAHRLGLSPGSATVRREIDQRYTRISPGHVIPTSRVRSLRLQRYDARFHPAHFSYAAGAITAWYVRHSYVNDYRLHLRTCIADSVCIVKKTYAKL